MLVIEDYELWRRHIRLTLQKLPQWTVIGEAADGAEAVQRAREQRPDLILLDVGLPFLNGVQAARRILAEDPSSRILFVSEHRSWDVVEVALRTGALGYVIKSDAGRELLPAMDAVIQGKRFVSARLGGRVVGTTDDERLTRESRRHEVGFYSDEPSLLDDYARFAETALCAGQSLVVQMTSSRLDEVHQRLKLRGIDVEDAIREGRYLPMVVPTVLSGFMVDGRIDEGRFWAAATSLIVRAVKASKEEYPRLAACGECSPSLLREGMADAAMRLEQLWDEVTRTYNVDVFCGYSSDVLGGESGLVQHIRAAHSSVHAA